MILTLLTALPAHALIDVPTFRLGLGYAPLKFTAGTIFPEPTSLGNFLTINPMFLWDVPSLRMRLGFDFITDLGSQYGFVSIAGLGLTAMLYPLGLSSSREVREDFSELVKTRVGPFFQFSINPTKLSVSSVPATTDPTYPFPGKWPYFAAKIIEMSFGAGADYPISKDLVASLGLHYRLAAWKAQETTSGVVSYNGIMIQAAVQTNFY